MSLVDPQQRWWRRPETMRRVIVVLWTLVFLGSVLLGWANEQILGGAVWMDWAGASYLVDTVDVPEAVNTLGIATLSIVPPVAVLSLLIHLAHQQRSGQRVDVMMCCFFGLPLAGAGLGGVISGAGHGRVSWLWFSLLVVGVVVLAIVPLRRAEERRRHRLQEHSRRNGRTTSAVVTKTDISVINDIAYYVVTLKYTDVEGNDRWLRRRLPRSLFETNGHAEPGDRFPLSYDPARPGKRSAIFVDFSRSAPEPLRDGASLTRRPGRRWKTMRPNGGV